MIAVLGLLLCFQAGAEPPNAQVAWATFRQEVIPGWDARARIAKEKARARAEFFRQQNDFADAFPSLVGAQLDRREVVQGRLFALQQRASNRETERQEPLPELGSYRHRRAAVAAREAALNAEKAADDWMERLLIGVDAHLARNPGLSAEGLKRLRDPLRDRLEESPPTNEAELPAYHHRIAAADADLVALEGLRRQLLWVAILGAEPPSVEADLQLLNDPLRGGPTAERLRLALPFLRGTALQQTTAALRAYATGPALVAAQQKRQLAAEALTAASTDELGSEEELRQAYLNAKEALDQADVALTALSEGNPMVACLTEERDAAADEVAAAELRLARLRAQEDPTEKAASAAERARREAEQAEASAADEEARVRADYFRKASDARDRVVVHSTELERRKQELLGRETHFTEIRDQVSAVLEKLEASTVLPLTSDADRTYSKLRETIREQAESPFAQGEDLIQTKRKIAEIRAQIEADRKKILAAPAGDVLLQDALQGWSDALDSERELSAELLKTAEEEYTRTLVRLRDLVSRRRRLRQYISWAERDVEQGQMFPAVGRELKLLQPTVAIALSTRINDILSFPWRLVRDGRLLVDLLWGMFWTVLLLSGWFWGRGKSGDVATRATWQVRRFRPDLRPLDLQRLKRPATDFVRAGIDLGLGYLMVGRISPLSPEIAFAVQCWLLLAMYRVFLGLFDLAVVKAPEFRPSLIALAEDAYTRVRKSARLIIVWAIARGFAAYVFWTMLGMDAVATLVRMAFNYVGLVLLVYVLYQWAPMLRAQVQARNQESKIVRYLGREVFWMLRPLASVAMLAFFALSLFVDGVYYLLARDRSGLATIFNVINRYQLGENEEETDTFLSEEVQAELCDNTANHTVYVAREKVDELLTSAYSGWKKGSCRGLVALIGDRGDGKRTEVKRFCDRVTGSTPVLQSRLTEALVRPVDVLAWLAEVAGVEPSEDPDTMIERLQELEPHVFVLGQVHSTFARSVGGFEGIQSLLYILNTTSGHHFWLVTVHRPAWRYLSAIPSLVDVGVFRAVVYLEPFTASMLRELCERRAKICKLRLDYTSLMRSNLLGADPRVELERAITTFYRLLVESSDGNPRVAMMLFARCLEPIEHGVKVHRRQALATDVARDLGVDALFILVALRQQDTMVLGEIVEVTNLPTHTVRNVARDLEVRGLVEQQQHRLYIPITKLPVVSRTLRRRHLLYLES